MRSRRRRSPRPEAGGARAAVGRESTALRHTLADAAKAYDWPLVCSLSRALRKEAQAEGHNKYESIESMVVDPDFNRHVDEVETVPDKQKAGIPPLAEFPLS